MMLLISFFAHNLVSYWYIYRPLWCNVWCHSTFLASRIFLGLIGIQIQNLNVSHSCEALHTVNDGISLENLLNLLTLILWNQNAIFCHQWLLLLVTQNLCFLLSFCTSNWSRSFQEVIIEIIRPIVIILCSFTISYFGFEVKTFY